VILCADNWGGLGLLSPEEVFFPDHYPSAITQVTTPPKMNKKENKKKKVLSATYCHRSQMGFLSICSTSIKSHAKIT